jgi:hypothetical protein
MLLALLVVAVAARVILQLLEARTPKHLTTL